MMDGDRNLFSAAFTYLRQNGIIPLFAILFTATSLFFPTFFKAETLGNLFRMASINGLLAVGVTYVIIAGDIDISVGSVMAWSCCVVGWMTNVNMGLLGIILAILSGLFFGFVMSVMIVELKMPPFIASLAILQSVRGLVFVTTNYEVIPVRGMPEWMRFIGRGQYLEIITTPAAIFIVLVLITSYIFRRTNIGRSIYAVGGNREAARMMGLKVDRTLYFAHMMCSACAALAGVVLTCRMGAVSSVTGDMAEMQAIAATVLGGTMLTGGVGKISGTFFGVMFMATLTNMFNMMSGVNTFWQYVITGVLLLLVVLSQSISQNKAFLKARN